MTVAELIAALNALPPEARTAPVYRYSGWLLEAVRFHEEGAAPTDIESADPCVTLY